MTRYPSAISACSIAHCCGHAGDHLVDGLDGGLARPAHHRRVTEHVIVVSNVKPVETGVGPDGEEFPVGDNGLAVGLLGRLPVPQPHVDMSRHVHVVGEAGLEIAQAIGGSRGPFRPCRRLDGVDVQVIRQRVVRPVPEHVLQQGDDLLGARLRLTVLLIEVPGTKVHKGLGRQRPTSASSGYFVRIALYGLGIGAIRPARSFGGSGTHRRARASSSCSLQIAGPG